ncbi:hypothetical protein RSK20926_11839 [Roseobacter sp. SK209-2-6]|uniref:hypothetical protein n=1 Tax=Roseobacter sp. SK209-2-6 TaxID=388739 RepID=UPI0000F3C803|nr:hypothetical protein [Roseobacter sp. SK209-2-6]EBA18409.1 hypothetical protein RSK20926_11839 [Roseobacter sp. SK209-2-6]
MQFKDLGLFEAYSPEGENPHGIIFCRNQAEEDFYEIARAIETPAHWFLVSAGGDVVSATNDLSRFAPSGFRIVEVTDGAALYDAYLASIGGGYEDRFVWANGAISQYIAAPEELGALAQAKGKAECARRIVAVADLVTQTNLLAADQLNKLSPTEKLTFEAGHDWIRAMQAAWPGLVEADADLSDDANWPAVPPGVAELAALY